VWNENVLKIFFFFEGLLIWEANTFFFISVRDWHKALLEYHGHNLINGFRVPRKVPRRFKIFGFLNFGP
jgi:hypothetical protein